MWRDSLINVFMKESLLIEGITRPPTAEEVDASTSFLALREITIPALEALVKVYTLDFPGVQGSGHARLREQIGLDVRVGYYTPPRGGPEIREKLETLLVCLWQGGHAIATLFDPWKAHTIYEAIHPFTDGNGRSGRMLWAWQMQKLGMNPFSLPFLHRFYYQTLDHQHSR